jgi:uncharacterized membrane protein YvbJ
MSFIIAIVVIYAVLRIARVAASDGRRVRIIRRQIEGGDEEVVERLEEQTNTLFERVTARVFLVALIIFVAWAWAQLQF